MARFGDLTTWMDERYPPRLAESWDRVGVVCGAPEDPVDRVLLTVDVTPAVVDEAIATGAQAIIAHHPLLLRGVHGVDPRTPKGLMVHRLIRAGIGLICAHTNGDSALGGVADAMARVIGLERTTPLVPGAGADLDQLVAFVPTDHVTPVVDALAAAGAGAIGDYDRCHFRHGGTGSFRPLDGADPYIGSVGAVEEVAEERVEMVLPRARRAAVLAALKQAHPYEEPAYHVLELASESAETGLGRVGRLVESISAAEFCDHLSRVLPKTVTGVRLAGDPERRVRVVALLPGAGDSLLDTTRRTRHEGEPVDAYVTSDLRHHPADEFTQQENAPVLIDVAHWAAESTWLPELAEQLNDNGPDLETIVSNVRTDPWTARF